MNTIKQDFLQVNPYTRPGIKLKGVKGVVIHWTANENAGADDVAHRRYFGGSAIASKSYASAHFFVDHDSILQIIPENEVGYHVGAISYQPSAVKKLGTIPNYTTIGVETCVNHKGANFLKALDQSAQLCAYLLKKNGLTVNDLYRHYDITWKNCPSYFVSDSYAKAYFGKNAGASTEWTKFKKLVSSYMVGKTTSKPAVKPASKPVATASKTAKATNGKAGDLVKVVYKTPVAVRDKADWNAKPVETADGSYTIKRRVEVDGAYMYELKSGLYITAMEPFVEVLAKKAPAKPKAKAETVEVIASQLNVRSSSNAKATVLFTAKKGDTFEVEKKLASGWLKLKTAKGVGYVNGKYVK